MLVTLNDVRHEVVTALKASGIKDIDNEFNVEGIVDDLYKLRDEENNTDSDETTGDVIYWVSSEVFWGIVASHAR